MKVLFMDGPKAGDLLEMQDYRISVPVQRHAKAMFHPLNGSIAMEPFDVVEYKVHRRYIAFFRNEHCEIFGTSHLAYRGPVPEEPGIDVHEMPWTCEMRAAPIPNFLTDFDRWWKRLLWDNKITQDRETRRELQRLEYAKGRIEQL